MTYHQTPHRPHAHPMMDHIIGLRIIAKSSLKSQTFYIVATRCPVGTWTLSSTFGQPLWLNMATFHHSPVTMTCMILSIRRPSVTFLGRVSRCNTMAFFPMAPHHRG